MSSAVKLESQVDERIHGRRFEGILRPYAKADVERLRGSIHIEYTLAKMGAKRLWELLHTEPFVPALGASPATRPCRWFARGSRRSTSRGGRWPPTPTQRGRCTR